MNKRTLLFWGLYILALSTSANATTPLDVVQNLQTALVTNAGNSDFSERSKALSSTIKKSHDFSTIARLVTGRHWRKFTPEQQTEFLDSFTMLSVMAYADNFKNLGDSQFSHIETIDLPRNNKKVISSLGLDNSTSFAELSDKQQLIFEYILRPNTSQENASQATAEEPNNINWQIINVVVDGISDLALKRSNYVSILSDQGFGGLVDELNQQIAIIQEKSK